MLLGLVVAVVFASQMPFLESVFVGEVAGQMVADARIWGSSGRRRSSASSASPTTSGTSTG